MSMQKQHIPTSTQNLNEVLRTTVLAVRNGSAEAIQVDLLAEQQDIFIGIPHIWHKDEYPNQPIIFPKFNWHEVPNTHD